MKISPINQYSASKQVSNFRASLKFEDSVFEVVNPENKVFKIATENFNKWLQTRHANLWETVILRKISSIQPKKLFDRLEAKTSYAYPFEECGYSYMEKVSCVENLEFELKGKKCGFWLDPKSNEFDLYADFRTVFQHLHGNK